VNLSSIIDKILKKTGLSSPTLFLLIGLVITGAFVFLPTVLDPLIIKTLPIEPITKDKKLIDYLKSIQDKDNVILGVRSYSHEVSNEKMTFGVVERKVQKGIDVFKKAGLRPSWIIPQGIFYNQSFLYVVDSFGYETDNYTIENESLENELKMVLDPLALEKVKKFKKGNYNINFKEYTQEWGSNKDNYDSAVVALRKDMRTSVEGLLLNIKDLNSKSEEFIKGAFRDYRKIRFLRVDDVASSKDIPRLERLVSLADENKRMLFIGVVPTRKAIVGNSGLSDAIKTTWFVFIPFFLFPLAVMVPLHWYERKKVRGKKNESSFLPKLSLVFPAYNEEKLIRKTIEQGLAQDYQGELEIVIIDDGSTDNTFQIASEYSAKYPNVIVHKHERNRGKPDGLNTGFRIATGEISVFSDSDSHLNTDLVSKMIPHFEDEKVGMVSGMIVIDNEVNMLTRLQQIEYLYNQEIIRFCQTTHRGVLICPGAATAVRTQIARDIPSTERTVTEDADFTFEVAKAGWMVVQEPEAISWTEAPEDIDAFIMQRKRWLYGVLQAIWIHKWALFFKGTKIPNLWVWWAWIGYITCPITTLAVIAMPILFWLLGSSYLLFLAWYSLIIFLLYGFVSWYGLKQYVHEKKVKLIYLLPFYIIYQFLLNTLLVYLTLAFITRRGVKVRYGGRDIHAI